MKFKFGVFDTWELFWNLYFEISVEIDVLKCMIEIHIWKILMFESYFEKGYMTYDTLKYFGDIWIFGHYFELIYWNIYVELDMCWGQLEMF